MGFFSKLKKIVPIVDKAATLGSSLLPGKAGQVAGDVATTSGVVTSIVQQIQAKSGNDISPAEAQQQATLATAVAVDDHEERVKALEAELAALRATLAEKPGQAGTDATSAPPVASGTSGQTGTAGPDGSGGQS